MNGKHLSAGLVILLGTVATARAVAVRPGFQIVQVKPGLERQVTFDVYNDLDKPITVTVELKDSNVLPENKAFTVDKWLSPTFSQLTIPAGMTRQATLAVKAPANAKGELAGFLTFAPEVSAEAASAGPVRIVTRTTVSLYARVEGTEKSGAELGKVNVKNTTVGPAAGKEIEASVLLKNTGNIHERPTGYFEIFKIHETKALYRFAFDPGWPTMPNSQTSYTARTAGPLAPGRYEVLAHVEWSRNSVIEKRLAFRVDDSGMSTDFNEIH